MSSAVNELEMCCSAVPSKTHGIAISIAANTSSGTQWPFNGRSSPRAAAMGNSSAAAIVVRPSTSTAGLRSRTATRIRRYGMPQITDIAANRSSPRLVTVQRYGFPPVLRQQDLQWVQRRSSIERRPVRSTQSRLSLSTIRISTASQLGQRRTMPADT